MRLTKKKIKETIVERAISGAGLAKEVAAAKKSFCELQFNLKFSSMKTSD